MNTKDLRDSLKFYFITDHQINTPILTQVKKAVSGGATMIQYRNKEFKPENINEVYKIADYCRLNKIPFIVNDDILLAKAVDADGVHLGQDDDNTKAAKKVLGKDKIVGISISNNIEFQNTDFSFCDYIGLGPIFSTETKPDAKEALGLNFLKEITSKTDLPVVAIGGIGKTNTKEILDNGACGISLISAVSRSEDIKDSAKEFAYILKTKPKTQQKRWENEFNLIEKLKNLESFHKGLKVKAGDDAALLNSLKRPVISTDTQREDVHFKLNWQSFYEIGYKAISITLSDLAASFAKPESVFINLGLPPYISEDDIYEVYCGMNENLLNYNVSIGGGNISKANRLSIDLFVIGDGKKIFPKRSNGLTDQLICTTGNLGLSKAGLEILMNNIKGYKDLVDKFKFPKPRFDAAKILKDFKIDCATDISDGLFGDIGHIAKDSELTAKITPETFVIDHHLEKYCKDMNKDPKEYIISGGEDYELLFTCSETTFKKIKKEIPSVFAVGLLKEFSGDLVECDIEGKSFDHGK